MPLFDAGLNVDPSRPANAAGTEVLATRHKLDPWVLSGGVSYRF